MEMQRVSRKIQLNSARRKREEIEFSSFSFVKERESLIRVEERVAESLKTAE